MMPRQTRSAVKAAEMGSTPVKQEDEPHQLSSPPSTPRTVVAKAVSNKKPSSPKSKAPAFPAKSQPTSTVGATVTSKSWKRKRVPDLKTEGDEKDLPHGLGNPTEGGDAQGDGLTMEDERQSAKKKRLVPGTPKSVSKVEADSIIADATSKAQKSPAKSLKEKKKKNYGHTPGKSPYPDWAHPTAEECYVVHDLLAKVHGVHRAPATIPAPSATFAGCGEVPSILDALIRTYLSAATSGRNSSSSIQGLHRTFPKLQEGTGQGSIDYNAIRLADVSVLFKAIESGGLAKVKSKNIKAILDRVHEENEAHRQAYKKRKETGTTDSVNTDTGAITLEKSAELTCANPNVLTLDHMHALSDNEAFNRFLTYPGIGVKTSSCVMLFCMKRPSFAVDTHVFRLCKWLGWVPENATRDKTFTHCEVMIPNELKYGLHQLFIKHGKTCGRCRAITGESSEGWDKGCVIDHLVKRTGARKGGKVSENKSKKKAKGKKKKDVENDGSEEDEDLDLED